MGHGVKNSPARCCRRLGRLEPESGRCGREFRSVRTASARHGNFRPRYGPCVYEEDVSVRPGGQHGARGVENVR